MASPRLRPGPDQATHKQQGVTKTMGLFDELKRLTRPYDDRMDEEDYEAEDEAFDDGYDDEPEPAPAPRDEPRRREYRQEPAAQQPPRRDNGKVVNIHATAQLKVVLVKPDRFENASEIADHLKDKRTVVLNLEATNKDIARRLIDFLSGVAYAQDGKIRKSSRSTYIITPYNVDLMGEQLDEMEQSSFEL